MTRIFDDPASFADDAITGFAAAYPDLIERIDGGVVRATEMPEGAVALVIGGGSGHYPAFAGMVGAGLAAGAACGNIFASPSAGQIARVSRAASAGGGVLLGFGNYAGDVLHFGQAERALRAEGMDVRTVPVTDDIASAPREQAERRRGIAGDLTVFKVAGASAERGDRLDEVERLARHANERTRTLGVAFAGCTLPGAGEPLFRVPEGMMAIGLGIHGEPGIAERPMATASELAALLVEALLGERPEGAEARVVPILNGLGTVKYDELFVLYGRIAALLAEAGIEVVAPEVGELVTSLDMSGVSLTLFWADEELLELWRAPAEAPAFRRGSTEPRARRRDSAARAAEPAVAPVEPATPAAASLGMHAREIIEAIRASIETHEDALGKLDAIAGDGDHGIGMRRGVEAAASAVRELPAFSGADEVLRVAGAAWADYAGGTSGALWGAGLISAGDSLGNREAYADADAVGAVGAFASAIVELGGAARGDKTMVDAILPFSDALAQAVGAGAALAVAAEQAAQRAVTAAVDTATLSPRLGRARPLAEKSLGHPDPGAVSFGQIVTAIAALPAARSGGAFPRSA